MTKFTGFPKQTLRFLRGLSANNEKAWFNEHRSDYDAYYVEPAKAFVVALGEKLEAIAPQISAVPKVNGSIFRVNRDVRFSKDKTPYKDHIDLWFWEGKDRKQGSSGFFFRLQHDRVILGAGIHGFPKEQLAAYRAAVDDDEPGKALVKIERSLAKAGYPLQGQSYKRVPRGFDAEHSRADLLRHGALHASVELRPLPAELHTSKFVALCVRHCKKLAPLHRWLVDSVQV